MFIYLDESGDLGFDWQQKEPSAYFTITLLVLNDIATQNAFSTAVKKTMRNKLNHKKSTRMVTELKGTGTHIGIKQYFYRHLPKEGWHIYSIVLNKKRVYPTLQTKAGKKKLYNYMARLLLEKVRFPRTTQSVTLTVDRCKNSAEMQDFNRYIETHLQGLLPLSTPLSIHHKASHDNPLLQAVDMFCWGVARKHTQHQACPWYQLFEDKIRVEEVFL